MINVYYTATTGRRNDNGHTITKGKVYIIRRGSNTTPHGEDALEWIGDYRHQSEGTSIEETLLRVCQEVWIGIGEGYYGNWSEYVSFHEI